MSKSMRKTSGMPTRKTKTARRATGDELIGVKNLHCLELTRLPGVGDEDLLHDMVREHRATLLFHTKSVIDLVGDLWASIGPIHHLLVVYEAARQKLVVATVGTKPTTRVYVYDGGAAWHVLYRGNRKHVDLSKVLGYGPLVGINLTKMLNDMADVAEANART